MDFTKSKKFKIAIALMGGYVSLAAFPSHSMQVIRTTMMTTTRMTPAQRSSVPHSVIHKSSFHSSPTSFATIIHKENWTSERPKEMKPQPWDYVLLPRVSRLAEFLFQTKDTENLTRQEQEKLKELLSGITLYKKYNLNDEDADWVGPRTLSALNENYTFFLLELIATLEEAYAPDYSADFIKNCKPHYDKNEIPGLVECVLSLLNQHNKNKVTDETWKSDSRYVYHNLQGLFSNYKDLEEIAVKCVSYPEFFETYKTIFSSNDQKLQKRPILQNKSTFFGPNDATSFIRQMEAFHRSAGDSYY